MYPVSAAFLAEIQQSHKIATSIYVTNLDTGVQTPLIIVDGNVTVQDTDIRRTATISALDPTGTLTPSTASDLIAPNGNEFSLFRGVTFEATGLTELAPLGVFRIMDAKIYDSGAGFKIDIEGSDRAVKVQLAKFTQELAIPAGTGYGTAIATVIAGGYPGVTFNFVATSSTTPALYFKTGDDRWAAARKMAQSIGCDLYFDALGICTLTPVPVLSSASVAVATYAEGPTSMLLYLNRRLTAQGVYSHVIGSGENNSTTAPVRAEALDTNPASPTYYLGPFGDVVDTSLLGSSLITSASQCQAAVNARLQKVVGFPDLVEMQGIVNAAHEVGDVIQITRARSKVNSKYLIDKCTIPMTQDRPMAISCRQGILPS